MMGNCVWLLLAFLPLLTAATFRGRLEHRQSGEDSPVATPIDEEAPPAFCRRVCPKFTVLEDNELLKSSSDEQNYELREYVATNWAATTTSGQPQASASSANFRRLYAYINGTNEEGVKINMTVPVLTRVQLEPGSDSFTMYFFVAPRDSSLPRPTSADIFFPSMASMRVYVRSFPGFATSEVWENQARQLARDLTGRAQYHKDYYFTAGYNSPYQMTNRHNEIWFIAQ